MNYHTIIVGAGPAGLQLGYFLQKGGYKYVILEKASSAASFFQTYPHSGKLISINKPNTGKTDPDFNLRHDWNSLLEDGPIRFTEYTDDYYPDHSTLVEYMNDYAKRNKLNIKYNTTVTSIKKGYVLETSNGVYMCDKLIMATGLSLPIYPTIVDNTITKPKHYGEYPKDYFKKEENLELFRNKSVLFIGNGNAAFELGNLLTPYCSSIVIQGRKNKEWALSTHYTGDLRSIYLPFFDTFLLKSLNAINNNGANLVIEQDKETLKYSVFYYCLHECGIKHRAYDGSIDGFDHIIYSTGWKFDSSIFDFPLNITKNEKYPHINNEYESSNNPGLYFIGSLMHSHDFKKSSGGFIHGFRYLIRYFFQTHYTKKYDIVVLNDLSKLVEHIVKRINTCSSLYQMYGRMCDIICYDKETGSFTIYQNMSVLAFPGNLFMDEAITYFLLTFEYGQKVTNILKLGEKESSLGHESSSTLLHPIMRVYNNMTILDEIHFDEDILANFSKPDLYADKFMREFKGFM